jgi:hypothetical protein
MSRRMCNILNPFPKLEQLFCFSYPANQHRVKAPVKQKTLLSKLGEWSELIWSFSCKVSLYFLNYLTTAIKHNQSFFKILF